MGTNIKETHFLYISDLLFTFSYVFSYAFFHHYFVNNAQIHFVQTFTPAITAPAIFPHAHI